MYAQFTKQVPDGRGSALERRLEFAVRNQIRTIPQNLFDLLILFRMILVVVMVIVVGVVDDGLGGSKAFGHVVDRQMVKNGVALRTAMMTAGMAVVMICVAVMTPGFVGRLRNCV